MTNDLCICSWCIYFFRWWTHGTVEVTINQVIMNRHLSYNKPPPQKKTNMTMKQIPTMNESIYLLWYIYIHMLYIKWWEFFQQSSHPKSFVFWVPFREVSWLCITSSALKRPSVGKPGNQPTTRSKQTNLFAKWLAIEYGCFRKFPWVGVPPKSSIKK